MVLEPAAGAPAVLARLVSYIENHGPLCGVLFRPCAGNPKLAERLRAQLEAAGDADLEAAGDPATAAQLLRAWLRELPQPLLPPAAVAALLRAHDLVQGEGAAWREAAAGALVALPGVQARSLALVLRLCAPPGSGPARQHAASCRHLPPAAALAPLLIRGEPGHEPAAAALLAALARDLTDNRLLDHAIQATVGSPDIHIYSGSIQRKRKERHDSFGQECKVIRSNSEERPLENDTSHCKDGNAIRRVSSHEDFSLVHAGHKADITNQANCIARISSLPLHERNPVAVVGGANVHQKGGHHQAPPASAPATVVNDVSGSGSTTVCEADLSDDNEHERQRCSERFSRSAVPRPARGRRNPARRQRRPGHHRRTRHSPDTDTDSSSKENEDEERGNSRSPHLHPTGSTIHYNSSEDEAEITNSHSFLQLHSPSQERERSPSPVPSASPPVAPPLDLKTLHQQVGESEPQPSRRGSGGAGSLTMHHLDPSVPPSPPHEHAGPGRSPLISPEQRLKALNKQAHSLKKKVKQFEEDFQKEYGYRPSHSDKMYDREMKKVCAELNKIRKEIKQLKEDPTSIDLLMDTSDTRSSTDMSHHRHKPRTMEEMVLEVEKHLAEKRHQAGRPDKVDELSPEQALDEKLAVQKVLLHMEEMFGRPTSRGDRDLVRPLYDRYRALKRLIIRAGSTKLKDSVSELATIHEHEAMEFTSSPLPPSLTTTYEADTAESIRPSLPSTSETLSTNLHSLPLSELLNQQRAAREDKKRLRRSLREFEEEFQQRTGRKLQKEDRTAIESIYTAYKHTKAKLRLLEALVSKHI
ncbi:protein FAM13A [Schistocerca cancellata]|uniref:protein FAM13A n=1 Tax=Schistocerca cancellata TaxID=274614 RepID=UPI0021187FE7|nr:protein FAM13A [Schistocerca cancellata]